MVLKCTECDGDGYMLHEVMTHHPECDGNCGSRCPVQAQHQEPCWMCGGSGELPVVTLDLLEPKP
jgi:hypothetical protein